MNRTAFCLAAAVAFLLIVGSDAMAANPTLPGTPGDGIPDLIIHSDGTATLDLDGEVNNGFILLSLGGNFTGAATLPEAVFITNDEFEARALILVDGFLTGTFDLGQLYDPAALPIFDTDLDFLNHHVSGATAPFDGNCIGCVPEPSTFVLAALALLGLVACGRRKRSTPPLGTAPSW